MALIVFASAAGSPGVTTTAVGLALTWPRPVLLVEADPTGGSAVLAGFFRGAHRPPGGVDRSGLGATGRVHSPRRCPRLTMPIPGFAGVAAAGGPGPWAVPQPDGCVGAVDGGVERVGVDGPGRDGRRRPARLDRFPGAADLRRRPDVVDGADRSGGAVGGPVVGGDVAVRVRPDRRGGPARVCCWSGRAGPYGAREVSKVLRLPVTAALPWDPDGAAVFSRGATPPRRFDRSPLPARPREPPARRSTRPSTAPGKASRRPTAGVPVVNRRPERDPPGAGRSGGCCRCSPPTAAHPARPGRVRSRFSMRLDTAPTPADAASPTAIAGAHTPPGSARARAAVRPVRPAGSVGSVGPGGLVAGGDVPVAGLGSAERGVG